MEDNNEDIVEGGLQAAEGVHEAIDGGANTHDVGVDESIENLSLELPMSALSRVMKARLPSGTVLSKDAKSSASKAASIFIFYLSSA